MELIALLLIGAGAGLIAGLVGLAGGVVIVPALTFVLGPSALHDAIVVSWFAVLVNSLGAAFKQYRVRDAGERAALIGGIKYFMFGAMVATAAIALAVAALRSVVTAPLIATLQLALAAVMLWPIPKAETAGTVSARHPLIDFISGGLVGGVSTAIGVGGGTYTIAYFVYAAKRKFQDAIATANVIGAVIGTMAVAAYLLSLSFPADQQHAAGPPPWLEIAAVLAPGLLCAPLGVRLSRRLPTVALRRILVFVLIAAAVRLMLSQRL